MDAHRVNTGYLIPRWYGVSRSSRWAWCRWMITCETLTNLWLFPRCQCNSSQPYSIFATSHTCARSRRPWSGLQSTNSQWNSRKHSNFQLDKTPDRNKVVKVEYSWSNQRGILITEECLKQFNLKRFNLKRSLLQLTLGKGIYILR